MELSISELIHFFNLYIVIHIYYFKTMGFIISCVVYIAICEGFCKMLELEDFDKKAWVYAIVGVVGGFIVKTLLA